MASTSARGSGGGAAGAAGIAAQVDVGELGSDAYLYGHLTDDGADGDTTVVVRTGGRTGARRGDAVTLSPSDDDLHLFHPESGDRL